MLRVMLRIMKIQSRMMNIIGSHSRRPRQMFSLFSITNFTRASSARASLSSENVVSGSNLVDVRKKNWGEDLVGVPPGKREEYFCTDSGRSETVPRKSFLTNLTSFTSPAWIISST